MRKAMKGTLVFAVAALLFLSFALTGCSKHPNEEELTALEETKQAALAAEEQLESKKAEKADLEEQLAEKKQKLENSKTEKEVVSERIANM